MPTRLPPPRGTQPDRARRGHASPRKFAGNPKPRSVLMNKRAAVAQHTRGGHGIDARRMQRAGYGRESTDRPEPRMWRRRSRLERLVAARSMCRRSYCPGLEDFTRAVAPSTSSAAARSAAEYRLSPARRCEREARRTREQRPRRWLWLESVSALGLGRVKTLLGGWGREVLPCRAHGIGMAVTVSDPRAMSALPRSAGPVP